MSWAPARSLRPPPPLRSAPVPSGSPCGPYVWLAHADFALGAWDDATAPSARAVSLLQESGHEWLRPLAHLAAILVPAARGAWTDRGGTRSVGARSRGRLRTDAGGRRTCPSPPGLRPRRSRGCASGSGARRQPALAGGSRRVWVLALAGPLRRRAGQRGTPGRGRPVPGRPRGRGRASRPSVDGGQARASTRPAGGGPR